MVQKYLINKKSIIKVENDNFCLSHSGASQNLYEYYQNITIMRVKILNSILNDKNSSLTIKSISALHVVKLHSLFTKKI